MPDLRLVVSGRKYGGWKSVRVTRSIESLAGSFDLEASDRWAGQEEPWPIAEEDPCRIEIDGTTVIDGYVDSRSIALSATDRSLSFAGRDRAAALVDSSVMLEQWTFRKATVLDVARKLAAPFGVPVSLQPGVKLPPAPRQLVVNPGDTAFQTIQRAAASAGVLVVSDGAGGIVITRAGTERVATFLIEGENILAAQVSYDAAERFHRYVVETQVAGTDRASGRATMIRAEAIDAGIRRKDRVLLIRPEDGVTTDYARQRADWEARVRAARAESVSITVHGWTQTRGGLWPLNALVFVRVPAIGVRGDLLISEIEHSLSDAGETTQLRLVRPDAFLPELAAVVAKPTGARGWKDAAGGMG